MTGEESLRGGNSAGEVVRVGPTVRRRPGTNADFVRRLLAHLAGIGFDAAPRWLGIDAAGRDVFAYIDGATTDHPLQRSEAAYRAGGRLLRALHDATSGHALAGGCECVLHGDPGPFNTIYRGGLPVALIDWDSAGPGDRLWDLSYMAWTWCVEGTPSISVADQARRLRELRDGYGMGGADVLVAAIVERQRSIAGRARRLLAQAGQTGRFYGHQRSAIAWAERDRRHLERHAGEFEAALR